MISRRCGAERVLGAAGHDQLGELGREEALQPAQALHLAHLLLHALLEGAVPLGQREGVPRLLVPEALLLEAGADPGTEQHGVARLGEIVLGPELDRADDAGRLVERRDHQDRDVAPVRVLLEPRQHRGPVEVRHHDVEEDEVDRLGLEDRERLGSALGHADPMALSREAPRQELAVLLVVVDHQDRGRRAPPVPRGSPDSPPRPPRCGAAPRARTGADAVRAPRPVRDQRPEPRHRGADALRVRRDRAVAAFGRQPDEPAHRLIEPVQGRRDLRGEAADVHAARLDASRSERVLDDRQERAALAADPAERLASSPASSASSSSISLYPRMWLSGVRSSWRRWARLPGPGSSGRPTTGGRGA